MTDINAVPNWYMYMLNNKLKPIGDVSGFVRISDEQAGAMLAIGAIVYFSSSATNFIEDSRLSYDIEYEFYAFGEQP